MDKAHTTIVYLFRTLALSAILAGLSLATDTQPPTPESISVNQKDMNWEKMEPAMGASSPLRAILHVDPVSRAGQFLVRVPKNFHVPMHWHGANETHTIIEGSYTIQSNGNKLTLQPGGFNYTPAHMPHEAWTSPDEGALMFVTIDGPYDLHVGAPPNAAH